MIKLNIYMLMGISIIFCLIIFMFVYLAHRELEKQLKKFVNGQIGNLMLVDLIVIVLIFQRRKLNYGKASTH
jgi:fumarate reductase subunit D